MRTLVLVFLAILLGAGALFFLLQGSGGRGSRPEGGSAATARTSADDATAPQRSATETLEPPAPLPVEGQRHAAETSGSAPDLRLILEGLVIGDGAPIPGARAVLQRHEGVLASVLSDVHGRFKLESEPLTTPATLRIVARGFVSTERSLAARPGGGTVLLGNLRVLRGQRLTGRVHDARGAGVADAEVRIEPINAGGDKLVAYGRSTPDGSFEVPDSPPGTVLVSVRARGFGEVSVQHSGDRPLDISLEPGLELHVRVQTPGGKPVVGATVSIEAHNDPRGAKRELDTDADGRALFEGLGSALWSLRVTHPDYRTNGRNQVQANGNEESVELLPWPAIEGRVRAPSGELPAGTRVLAMPAIAGPSDRITNVEGGQEVARDGGFRIGGLRGGDWRVRVTAPGFAPALSQVVKLGIEGDGQCGTIDLKAGGTLTLRLRRGDQPVAGASVEVFGTDPSSAQLWAFSAARGMGMPRRAATDASGIAVLQNLNAGPVWVGIYADGSPPTKSGPHVVSDGPAPAPLEVELRPGARLSGRVLGHQGQPLARAQLRVIAREGELGFPLTLASEEDGRYTTAWLPPGKYVVEAFSPEDTSSSSGPKEVVLTAGEQHTLDLQL